MKYTKYITFEGEQYELTSAAYLYGDAYRKYYVAGAIRMSDRADVKLFWLILDEFYDYLYECERGGVLPDESRACMWDEPDYIMEV